ncbi:MAG: hypothetical protein WCL49_10755 [bacterium]
MTPEEKLLALIQQDKRQVAAPVAAPVAMPAATPVAVPVTMPMPVVVPVSASPQNSEPAPLPQPVKKLKLAGAEEKSEVSIQKVEVPSGRLKNTNPIQDGSAGTPRPTEIQEISQGRAKPPAESEVFQQSPSEPEMDSEVYGLKSKVSLFSVSMSPLAILNRVMTVLVIGLIAVVFYSIMSIRPGIAQDLSRQIEGAGSLAVVPQTIVAEEIPALDIYLEKVGSRSLFASKMIPKPGDTVVIEKAGALKDLSLVAVSMDSASPADSMAIIKNKTDSKTYFVKLGQTVGSTDYVLDRVLADRIVLKQKKLEFELK